MIQLNRPLELDVAMRNLFKAHSNPEIQKRENPASGLIGLWFDSMKNELSEFPALSNRQANTNIVYK